MIGSIVDNGDSHHISWPHGSRHLSWLHGIPQLAILHAPHISHRDWVDYFGHCLFRVLRGDERKLLPHPDSKNNCMPRQLRLNLLVILVLRASQRRLHSWTLSWHHRIRLERVNLFASQGSFGAHHGTLHKWEYESHCNCMGQHSRNLQLLRVGKFREASWISGLDWCRWWGPTLVLRYSTRQTRPFLLQRYSRDHAHFRMCPSFWWLH